MNTAGSPEPMTPKELSARLEAAGATDEASLKAVLARDPDLRAAVEALAVWQSASMTDLIDKFEAVEDHKQMFAFWQGVPIGAQEPLIKAIETALGDVPPDTDPDAIEDVRAKLDLFKRICEEARAAAAATPVLRALVDFANATDDAAARDVFKRHRDLLQTVEAQQILDENALGNSDVDFRPRLFERAALLRRLRGAGLPRTLPVSRSRWRK